MSSYRHDDRLMIVFKSSNEYGKLNEVAIHVKTDDFREIDTHVETAARDGFDLIIIYSNKLQKRFSNSFFSKRTFIKRSMHHYLTQFTSDVRIGTCDRAYGQNIGQGFTLFDWR